MSEETYIRLTAPITPQSTQRLLQIIDQKYQAGIRKVHLLLSTPGGSVAHGIGIYNVLKGLPMEVFTYNIGTVDSIGIIIFCAGEKRLSVPNARFFLHPVGVEINQGARVDEHWLREHTASLKIDQQNIAKVIGDTAGKDHNAVLRDIGERKSLNPEEAKEYGLVHEVQQSQLPMGADFVPIYESEAQPTQPAQIPLQMQIAGPPGIVAVPPQENSTSIYDHVAASFTRVY